MKFYLIVSLIAVIFFKQTNHQVFWLPGLSLPKFTLSLASEEFIPQASPEPQPPVESIQEVNVEQEHAPSVPSAIVNESPLNKDSLSLDEESKTDGRHSVDSQKVDVINIDRIIPQEIPVDVPSVRVDDLDSSAEDSKVLESKPISLLENEEHVIKKESVAAAVPVTDEVEEDTSGESSKSESKPAPINTTSELDRLVSEIPKEVDEPIPSFLEWTQLQQKKLQELHSGGSGGNAHSQNSASSTTNGNTQNQNQQNGNQPANISVGASNSAKKETDSSSATKNFASPDCGAKVIQSNPGSQNPNGVLSSSHDEYMLNKCGIPVWFVIELCEPLKIEKVSLGNLELFSSSPKEFDLGISDRFPAREWNKLGPFQLPDSRFIHPFTLPATNSSTFGKFLKVNILSHHGTEHYCPLSVVRVNGKSEYEVLESETTHAEDVEQDNKEGNALHEEHLEEESDLGTGKSNERSVFGSATDAVLSIVKKAAQVLAKGESSPSNDSLLNVTFDFPDVARSRCQSMTHCLPPVDQQTLKEINSLISCNSSNLFPFIQRNSAWCGWERCHNIFRQSNIGLPWQIEGFFASLFGGPNVLIALCHFLHPLKEPCDAYIGNKTIFDSTTLLSKEANYDNLSLTADPGTIPINVSTDPTSSSEVGGTTSSPVATTQDQLPSPPNPALSSPSSPESTTENQGEVVQQIPAPPPATQSSDQGAGEDSQYQHQTQTSSGQMKESVFVRLSNRIKTLERNQSLTASYLEELSRRFKKQNEDNHNLSELMKKQMNYTQEKTKYMEELLRMELSNVRRNLSDMRERLFTVQIQRSLLILICLIQFIFMLFGCLWLKRKLARLEANVVFNRKDPVEKPLPVGNISGRKRANSDVAIGSNMNKVKKIKKKKKNIISNSDNIATGSGFNFRASNSAIVDDSFEPRKENVNPIKSGSPVNSNNSNTIAVRPSSFKYEVKNDGSSQSTFDPGSSRFGILASPSPSEVFRTSVDSFKNSTENHLNNHSANTTNATSLSAANKYESSSGELTNSSSGTSSLNSNITNSNNGNNSKKTKKGGLKSLMPRIFDR